MANSVTRCPKCETSFRVTEAHLNSAKGAVRCGSCLHIFNARDYLVVEPGNEPVIESAITTKAKKPAEKNNKEKMPPKSKIIADEDDVLIDDYMGEDHETDSGDFGSNVIMASTFGPSESNLFERTASDDDDDNDGNDPDESWAESLLADDDEEEPQKLKVERKPEAPPKRELFKSREARSGTSGNFYGTEPPKPPGSKLADDQFEYTHTAREDDDYEPPLNRSKTGKRSGGPTLEELEGDYQDEYLEEEKSYEEIDYGSNEFEPEIGDIDEIDDHAYRDQYGTTSNSRYLHRIEPEPVEFNIVTSYPIWQSKALWMSLACAAAFILFIQIAIFRFDDLSVVQPWRA